MKSLLLLAISVALLAQSNRHDKALAMPTMAIPPVIVLVPNGGKVSAMLLATRDVPAGTNVLPVVTTGKQRSILPSFQVSAPGVYPMAIVPEGSDVIAYITPPTGVLYQIRSASIVRGYQYDGAVLAIYGNFIEGQLLVYVGTSLVPVKPTLKQGHLEISLKPTGAVATLTIYQAGGFCDSVLVRLKQVAQVR